MATVEIRGYVNYPEAKTTKTGKVYSKFSLGVKQKDKDREGQELITYANFQVTDWNNSSPPEKGAYCTIKGYLKVREADVSGVKRTFLEVNAQELEVAPPFADAAPREAPAAPTTSAGKDPWEE